MPSSAAAGMGLRATPTGLWVGQSYCLQRLASRLLRGEAAGGEGAVPSRGDRGGAWCEEALDSLEAAGAGAGSRGEGQRCLQGVSSWISLQVLWSWCCSRAVSNLLLSHGRWGRGEGCMEGTLALFPSFFYDSNGSEILAFVKPR